MIAMDDTRVIFDGVDLYHEYGLLSVNINNSPNPHLFAGNKNITAVRPIYKSHQVATSITAEPLTFSLTFALEGEWTDELVSCVYQLFDVREYKPLRFGDDQMYFNVIPYAGSVSEMMLFAQNGGYVTIPFQCDAPHGWIDIEAHFKRDPGTAARTFNVYNPCNVKDCFGTYRVYPYIVLSNFGGNIVDERGNVITGSDYKYVSFGLASEILKDNSNWYSLYDLPIKSGESETPSSDNEITRELHIDCYNQQVYDSANQINLLNHMYPLKFFYLEQGENEIWHRTLVSDKYDRCDSFYDMDIYLTCPYMK